MANGEKQSVEERRYLSEEEIEKNCVKKLILDSDEERERLIPAATRRNINVPSLMPKEKEEKKKEKAKEKLDFAAVVGARVTKITSANVEEHKQMMTREGHGITAAPSKNMNTKLHDIGNIISALHYINSEPLRGSLDN
ncbi:Hypothetical predicted protein [Octopus vulgaris]|uniref:Uncharacterized protein n=1 Tax=Octopus vulgaris TaxID=6645 RepID=A0AA36EY27_OCTVU|nr:Hypothetical predicted protein [Octopus vulgaris]